MFFLILFFLSAVFFQMSAGQEQLPEKPIVVVIPSCNNKKWYKQNLDSVFMQKYTNYRVIYIDDASTDGMSELVKKYIEKCGQGHRVTLIRNEVRHRQLANHYMAGHMCNDWEIIVDLDGDDWFAHDRVLSKVNQVYADSNVWMTYGQYRNWPQNRLGLSRRISARYNLRKRTWVTSHLRTFYAWLFKSIKREDLLDVDGDFYHVAADFAIMFPMLEMAGHAHRKFIPEVLYIYNRARTHYPRSFTRKKKAHCSRAIRKQKSYERLKTA